MSSSTCDTSGRISRQGSNRGCRTFSYRVSCRLLESGAESEGAQHGIEINALPNRACAGTPGSFELHLLCSESAAAPIQYEFAGFVTEADSSTGIAPGTRFSGTFAYDPAKISGGISIEGLNQANFGQAANWPGSVADGSGLSLQIGGQTILANPGGVSIATSFVDYPGQFGYRDATGNPENPYTTVVISNSGVDTNPLQVALILNNPTVGFRDSTFPLNLTQFPNAQLNVTLLTNPGSKTLYTGTIDSLVELSVPEPTLGTALCLVAIVWFLKKQRPTVSPSPVHA